MIKHVWFDMAGTLYRETSDFNVLHDELRYRTYAKLVGQDNPVVAKHDYDALYDEYGSNSAVFTSLGMPSDYWQLAFDNMDLRGLVKPDDEITQALAKIKEAAPISVFTNLKLARTQTLIRQLGIPLGYFTNVLSGDNIAKRKPALDGFHRMIELSNVSAGEILYVGDREKVDIKPAKQVGMMACMVWGASEAADYNAQDFSELVSIIKSVTKK